MSIRVWDMSAWCQFCKTSLPITPRMSSTLYSLRFRKSQRLEITLTSMERMMSMASIPPIESLLITSDYLPSQFQMEVFQTTKDEDMLFDVCCAVAPDMLGNTSMLKLAVFSLRSFLHWSLRWVNNFRKS